MGRFVANLPRTGLRYAGADSDFLPLPDFRLFLLACSDNG